MQKSKKEVTMLGLFMNVTIVLYSTCIYFLEKDLPGSDFESIPSAFWWCITTMTTVSSSFFLFLFFFVLLLLLPWIDGWGQVGYGDMVPISTAGKVVASLTSISGVVVLGFPIAIIVENFDKVPSPPLRFASSDGGDWGQVYHGDGAEPAMDEDSSPSTPERLPSNPTAEPEPNV